MYAELRRNGSALTNHMLINFFNYCQSGLKTFEIIYNLYTRIMKQHLTLDELDLFKELLLAMNGMDEIIISYLLQVSYHDSIS